MIWQSYDSIDAAVLDAKMTEELKSFLQRKEGVLAVKIIEAIDLDRSINLALESSALEEFTLSQAVEEFSRIVHHIIQIHQPHAISPSWEEVARILNAALWDYLEVLEGSTTELFQQINQIGFEQWDLAMSRAVTVAKDELTYRMDTLIWSIRRLEQQLKSYRAISLELQGGLKSWARFFGFRSLLDSSLISTVYKCRKFLNFRYGKFIERYRGCVQLYEVAQKDLNAFRKHKNLSIKNLNMIDRYEHFFQLLNLWSLNRSGRVLPRRETIRAVRRLTTQSNAISLFRNYLKSISTAIYDRSRLLKLQFPSDIEENEVHRLINNDVEGIKFEIEHLKDTIAKYRKFTIETDPLLTRKWNLFWGKKVKDDKIIRELDALKTEAEKLNDVALEFQDSLLGDKLLERRITPEFEAEINHHFHEMDQPLASKDLMRRHVKALLIKLESLDELGAFHGDVVEYMCLWLCKALLADWKYHVIQEFPLFHKIYATHEAIVTPEDNRAHVNRLEKFKHLISQLERWCFSNKGATHAHDIELDINDIRAYLQDFFAEIQRFEDNQEEKSRSVTMHEIFRHRQCLLECLYLFGNFFHKLSPDEPNQWLLRTQLLFVDQYFKAIDNTLNDLLFKERI